MRTILILLATTLPAAAETITCLWETECFDTNACEETSFETYLTADGTDYVWESIAGGTPMLETTSTGPDAPPMRTFAALPSDSNPTTTVLALGADGFATFTQQSYLEDITSVTYYGYCGLT